MDSLKIYISQAAPMALAFVFIALGLGLLFGYRVLHLGGVEFSGTGGWLLLGTGLGFAFREGRAS